MNDNNPILVAAAAVSQKITEPAQLVDGADAIDLMVQACRKAAVSIGCEDLLSHVEQVAVPQGLWAFTNPASCIAKDLGAASATTVLGKIGVLQQGLISGACNAIRDGEKSLCVVAGGEAKYRELIAGVNGIELPQREAQVDADIVYEPGQELWLEAETNAGLGMPVGYYALMDSAWRHAQGRSIDEHRDQVADMYAQFSEIAAGNPDAWKRKPLTADAVRNASKENPMLAFPYTKRHNTSWNVDQASAVIICSVKKARELGIDEKYWIYPAASTECSQILSVSQRQDLSRSIGAEKSGQAALQISGIDAASIDYVDLYSCFPVAMLTYADALGLPKDKALTVTGAMPFAGGPLNNYVLQATAKMVEVLQANPGSNGVVSTVSGMMTKQGFGLYRTDACEYRFADVTADVETENTPIEVLADYAGAATVVAATVLYDKAGQQRAVVIADTADGKRCLGYSTEPAIMARVEAEDWVGVAVQIANGQFSA